MKRGGLILVLSLALGLIPTESVSQNIFQKGLDSIRGLFKSEHVASETADTAAVANDQTVKSLKSQNGAVVVADDNDTHTLEQLYEMSLDENLSIPKLGSQKESIREYQLTVAKKMIVAGYTVETMRSGEVVIITIPSDELFLPNEVELSPRASKVLKPCLQFLKIPDFYRVLLVMHSDNTGTAKYTDRLTESRVLSVLDWFQMNAAASDYVIPYAMGASEPLLPNNSIDNRASNRRLEIYLVPGLEMIGMSKKGQLH